MSFLNKNASDYNSLKKQRDNGSIVKKYSSKKLKPEPSEQQKYFQYLTFQQPILDEINYSAEKNKNENLKKQKEDWEYTEKLKEEREKTMKEKINKTETKEIQTQIKNDLFDAKPELFQDFDPTFITNDDLIIMTEQEPDIEAIKREVKKDEAEENKLNSLSFDLFDSPFEDKSYKTEAKNKYEEYKNKFIDVSSSISDLMNRPIIKSLPEPSKSKVNTDFFINITKDLPIKEDLQISKKKGGGRPKGSRTNYETLEFNRNARKLDLTEDEPIIIDKRIEQKKRKEEKKAEKEAEKQIKREAKKAEREAKKANKNKK